MRTFAMLLIALLVTFMLGACQPLRAPAQGTYGIVGPPIERAAIPAGDGCLVNIVLPYSFDGSFEGEAQVHLAILGKGPCEEMAPGAFDETIAARGTFTGAVEGKTGGFDFLYILTVDAGEPFEGLIRAIPGSGSGDLEGLEAELIVTGDLQSGEHSAYVGGYSFAP